MDLAAAVSELIDRQSITDLIHGYCYHFDPVYFPSPHTFKPDRWRH